MYDIKRLEEEWKQYNKNKKKPLYFMIVLILVLFLISVFLLNERNITFPKIFKPFLVNEHKKDDEILIHKGLNDLEMNQRESIKEIKPSKPIKPMVNLNRKENTNNIPTLPIVNNIPIIDDVLVEKRKVDKKVYKKPILNIVMSDLPRKKVHLNIIESSSVSAYKDVEKRFRQSHDTDDSIFLAKNYFRKGQYSQAEFWALETNKINPNIEESWLIFVKAKIKLGQKNEAIRILTNYAKKSNSSEAWNLLLKLKK